MKRDPSSVGYKSMIGTNGRNAVLMDVLGPKEGVAWFESVPTE